MLQDQKLHAAGTAKRTVVRVAVRRRTVARASARPTRPLRFFRCFKATFLHSFREDLLWGSFEDQLGLD